MNFSSHLSYRIVTSVFVALAIFLAGCASFKPYYKKSKQNWETSQPTGTPSYSLFLLGDAGEPMTNGEDPVLNLLQTHLLAADQQSSVALLGDNIYPIGMVGKSHPKRAEAEAKIKAQLDIMKDYKGKVYVIPGNHDWEQGGKNGYKYVRNQEKFVEKYLDRGNVFMPDDGCPGPVEISVNEDITMVIIDTQWWLHKKEKPEGEESSCEAQTDADFLLQVHDILKNNAHKQLIVLGHHPMYTHGSHGGQYAVKDHLFPLVYVSKDLYIPLPVLGSLMPMYRSVLGNIQDIPHPRYRELREGLLEIFEEHPNLIYANGHEHALEHMHTDSLHFITSGSGSKRTAVGHSKKAHYTDPTQGFAILNFYPNGDVWAEYWVPGEDGKGEMRYREKLFNKKVIPQETQEELFAKHKDLDYTDSVAVVRGSLQYEAGGFKKFVLGDNYRDVWAEKIEVPVFDIGREKGGLRIVQRGGGQQTKSLRLEAADGRQYVLRSIEKFASGAVPEIIRGTFAEDLVQDQISSSHPYGAFAVPKMAEAAGIYHTNPVIVYIPDDPRLGKYREDFANTLALHEERPAGDRSSEANFGNSKKVVSTTKVLEKLQEDNDNYVDQQFVLRSRLFDLVIGDWDRHDDQWRWASFEKDKGKMYRPIPRDRDQAFFQGDGPVMWLVGRKWALPKFQGFHESIRDVPGLAFNARFFDRSFLTGLAWEDWAAMVDSIQQSLGDDIIDASLKDWPAPIHRHSAEETARKLKARRDSLENFARDLYLFLAEEVDIVGSDKDELFEITRISAASLRINVYKLSKSDQTRQVMYSREFKVSETKEIRLYGHDGDDVFQFMQQAPTAIKVRIIGGDGHDQVSDLPDRNTGIPAHVYDLKEEKDGITFPINGNFIDHTSNKESVNDYDRKAFKYDILSPAAFFGFNIDDGLFVGGGINYTKHAWRKEPAASTHLLVANFAPFSSSYNLKYNGNFYQLFGHWGLNLGLDANVPQFNNTFFGLGNETEILPEKRLSFYWINAVSLSGKMGLFCELGDFSLHLTPSFQFFQLDRDRNQDRFIADASLNQLDSLLGRSIADNLYEERVIGGGNATFQFEDLDNQVIPTRGIHLSGGATLMRGLNEVSTDFTRFHGVGRIFFTFHPIRTTVAAQIGGAVNYGEWDFWQANTIGLNRGLRGYRNNRFAGRSAAYANVELRTRFGTVRGLALPFTLGSLFFMDNGRVWMDGEDSDNWHQGYGGGLWIAPLDAVVLSVAYAVSEENPLNNGLIVVKAGFGF